MNIVEKAEEFQELISQQYGIRANIEIRAFGHKKENCHLNRDTIWQLGLAMGRVINAPVIDHRNEEYEFVYLHDYDKAISVSLHL